MKIKRHSIIIFLALIALDLVISVINYIIRGQESVSDILMFSFIIVTAFFVVYFGLKFIDVLFKRPLLGYRIMFMIMGIFCSIVFGLDVLYDVRSLFHVTMPLSTALACLVGILDIKISPKSDVASTEEKGLDELE